MIKRTIATTLATAALATGALMTAPASAASATTCPSGSWDATTLGVPAGAKPGMSGAAVFRKADTDVFSVRVSTARPSALYTGSITTTNGRLSYRTIRVERGDVIRQVSPHKIVFAMTNRGHLDGIDVRAACTDNVTFSFGVNGKKLATDHIVVGGAGSHPAANPFSEAKA